MTVDLIPPGIQYTDRLNQVSFRMTKTFRFGRGGRRIQAMVDLYNVLNANSLLVINNSFNNTWPGALSVLQGWLLKFGTQVDF